MAERSVIASVLMPLGRVSYANHSGREGTVLSVICIQIDVSEPMTSVLASIFSWHVLEGDKLVGVLVARARARTHTHTHARTHARTHTPATTTKTMRIYVKKVISFSFFF